MASGLESKDNTLQPFLANEMEKGATPANASNTSSPFVTREDNLSLSVANLGEK